MNKVTVFRGIVSTKEQAHVELGKITADANWYSTDISDAINFAMKTNGSVIKCEIDLKARCQDRYLRTLDHRTNYRGWGSKNKKTIFRMVIGIISIQRMYRMFVSFTAMITKKQSPSKRHWLSLIKHKTTKKTKASYGKGCFFSISIG